MKRNITICLLLSVTIAYAQKAEIIADSSKNKLQFQNKTIQWAALQWRGVSDVVELNDVDAGIVLLKIPMKSRPGVIGSPAHGKTIGFLTIRTEDGRVKFEFDRAEFKWIDGVIWKTSALPLKGKRQWEKWKKSIEEEVELLIMSYKNSLSKNGDF